MMDYHFMLFSVLSFHPGILYNASGSPRMAEIWGTHFLVTNVTNCMNTAWSPASGSQPVGQDGQKTLFPTILGTETVCIAELQS